MRNTKAIHARVLFRFDVFGATVAAAIVMVVVVSPGHFLLSISKCYYKIFLDTYSILSFSFTYVISL